MENVVNPRFWSGRRVFLTGHTGFKGGWLSLWLQEMGALVHGYALAPEAIPNLFHVARVADGTQSTIGDLRDGVALNNALRESGAEIVIHMAAQPLVRRSYANPVETYSTNIMGLVNLLEAVRASKTVAVVVNVTSDKCYENREWIWGYRENDPMGGFDPYSSSKGCAEVITAAYRRSFFEAQGVAVGTARAGNVLGGGDWSSDRLVPDIIKALTAGRPAEIRNPLAVRPWQHVLEPLSGYLRLAEKLHAEGASFSEGWNFGPGDEQHRRVNEVADELIALWGGNASWYSKETGGPHEATLLSLDCTRARLKLGWTPRWNVTQTLERVVEWHRSLDAGADMREQTLSQIKLYQEWK
jgi:CDP-glucose 4,6-dehydratase